MFPLKELARKRVLRCSHKISSPERLVQKAQHKTCMEVSFFTSMAQQGFSQWEKTKHMKTILSLADTLCNYRQKMSKFA